MSHVILYVLIGGWVSTVISTEREFRKLRNRIENLERNAPATLNELLR